MNAFVIVAIGKGRLVTSLLEDGGGLFIPYRMWIRGLRRQSRR